VPRIWLSLGSNQARERSLRGAVRRLREAFGPLVVSPVYESAAVGFAGDPFLNLVVGAETEWPIEAVQQHLRKIEDAHGRVRGPDRFAPRTLDIDLLTYGDAVRPELDLPRDEIERYAFVLGPLADVAPDEIHPTLGQSYGALWAAFDRAAQPLRPVELCLD
jgi:2-amino-4-hydroxy-6-hydroxymethyldihydropteridine diphosphokinase